jgi:hypothetical protein
MLVTRHRANRTITIGMPSLIAKMEEKYGHLVKGRPLTPAKPDLCSIPEDGPAANSTDFASLLMYLLYLGRFVKPSILFPVCVLASYLSKPTDEHMQAAIRIFAYTLATRDEVIELGGNAELAFTMSVDASYNIYADGRSQGCLVILLGGRLIIMKTYRITHVVLSSTEAELSALCQAATYVEWLRLLGREMFLPKAEEPIVIEQDNSSAILMNDTGGGSFKRSKHIIPRRTFITERIVAKEAVLKWTPTADIKADLGTKVHNASRIAHLQQMLAVVTK